MTLICVDTCGDRSSFVKNEIRSEIEAIINDYHLDPEMVDICLFSHKLYSNMSYDMFLDDETLDYVLTGKQPIDYQRFFDALDNERGRSNVQDIFVLTDGKAFEGGFAAEPWIEGRTTWIIDDFDGEVPADNGELFGTVRFYNADGFVDEVTPVQDSSTVADDRKIVESIVKKYGSKDVIKFVSSINEGKSSNDPKEEKNIYLSAFKKVNRQALVWLCKYFDGEMAAADKKLLKDAIHTAMNGAK